MLRMCNVAEASYIHAMHPMTAGLQRSRAAGLWAALGLSRAPPRAAGRHVVAEQVPGGADGDHDGGHEVAAHGRHQGARAPQKEGGRPHHALQVNFVLDLSWRGHPRLAACPGSSMSACHEAGWLRA